MRLLKKRELSQRAATPTQMFDNNQPTMVRKCQMANKKVQTSAPQSRAKDQNVILPTSKKKSNQQPPPASWHRSLSTLAHVVLLFDMRANTSNNIYNSMQSSREAIPIQRLKTITTDRLSQVEGDPRYVELFVSFCSPPEDDANNFKKR
jgi:hypothetical protein